MKENNAKVLFGVQSVEEYHIMRKIMDFHLTNMNVADMYFRAIDDFNNAVVLTNRQLQPGELFEVQLDQLVDKWAGSIEIGVTTHSPLELEFPSTMTNVRSGTWMMTGNGVMHNGATVLEDYGQNLDQLRVG